MEPEDVVTAGIGVVAVGIVLTAFSIFFFAQVYSCILSSGVSCPPNAEGRLAQAFPLMIVGGYMIIVGAIIAVGGYIVSNLETNQAEEVSTEPGTRDL